MKSFPLSSFWQKCAAFVLTTSLIVIPVLGDANAADRERASKIVPVLMMLLEEDGPIPLVVGQESNEPFSSDDYQNGIEFNYPVIKDEIRLSINVSDIPAGAEIEIYFNGSLLGNLVNGDNVFTIPSSSASENIILIKAKDGTTGAWTINSILSLLATGPQTRAEAQRFLTRATFGPRLSEIDRVLEIGYEAWIDEQIATPPTFTKSFYEQALIDRHANLTILNDAAGIDTDPNLGLGQQIYSRLDSWYNATINGKDQLRQRMAFALSEIFAIGDIGSARRVVAYQDILINEALGNYEPLLKDVTVSTAMGVWLNFSGSRRGDDSKGTSADENYAREVQQLFTIGLNELNMNGTPKLDANGNTIQTYSPELIGQFARVFTGWNWPTRPSGAQERIEWEYLPLVPKSDHDLTEKQLHAYSGTDGVAAAGLEHEEDLDFALDNLFNHPNVAPFISKQLIQRLVTSNPSPEYVERVANVFHNNNGVRGDLAATAKAILLDPEALNSHTLPLGGKVKEPLLRVTQLWRAFNAKSEGNYIRYASSSSYGQIPFVAPSVFNFFPAEYASNGEVADNNLISPELFLADGRKQVEIINALGTFALSKGGSTTPPGIYSSAASFNMILDLTEAKSHADNINGLLDFLDERLFGDYMSESVKNAVIEHLESFDLTGTLDEQRTQRVEEALVILTAVPEYSIQR